MIAFRAFENDSGTGAGRENGAAGHGQPGPAAYAGRFAKARRTNPRWVDREVGEFVCVLHMLAAAPDETTVARAVAVLTRLADEGFLRAATLLGIMYDEGLFVSVDFREAVRWLSRGTELGGVNAAYRLGLVYLQDDFNRDIYRGVPLIRQAALRGFAPALRALGDIFRGGIGVLASRDAARHFYVLAAARGDEAARKIVDGDGRNGGPEGVLR